MTTKLKICGFLLTLLTPLMMSFLPIITADITYKHEYIGPFYKDDGLRSVSLQYTYNASKTVSSVIDTVTIYQGEKIVGKIRSQTKTKAHSLVKGKTYDIDFSFYPSNVFDDIRGAYFDIEISQTVTGDVIDIKSFHLFLAYENTVNENLLLEDRSYEISGTFTTLSTLRVRKNEVFYFEQIPEYVDTCPMGLLDISLFKFTYLGINSLQNLGGFIEIKNLTNVFYEIGKYENTSNFFPFELVENNGVVSFNMTNNYVDPKTLEMSYYQKTNYIKTNNIYFPYTSFGEIEEVELVFHFNPMGLNRTSFNLKCMYYPTGVLLGDCSNSDYCIVGGLNG